MSVFTKLGVGITVALLSLSVSHGTLAVSTSTSSAPKAVAAKKVVKKAKEVKKAVKKAKKAVKKAVKKASSSAAAVTCTIKGNIGAKKEQIYHVLGCPNYSQTVIDTAAGEKIFCTEKEAKAAGWRKALNCPK